SPALRPPRAPPPSTGRTSARPANPAGPWLRQPCHAPQFATLAARLTEVGRPGDRCSLDLSLPCLANAPRFGRLSGTAAFQETMAAHYLEFERPIAELESKIEELHKLSETAGAGAFDAEIAALRERVVELRREAYANLGAWQKTQIARHPDRPHFLEYVEGLIEEFV